MREHRGEQSQELAPYERQVACSLAAVLIFLAIQSYLTHPCAVKNIENSVSIHVVGAVKEETVIVPQGATVDAVLQKIALQDNADLLDIDGSRRFVHDEILVVPFHDKLTVYITGSVIEPKLVVTEKTATVAEIIGQIRAADDADIKRVLRRRRFRNATVLTIPQKTDTKKKQ